MNLRKIVLIVAVIAILGVGFFGLDKKFHFLSPANPEASLPSSPDNLAPAASLPSDQPSSSQSTSSQPSAANPPSTKPPASVPQSILQSVPFFSQAPFGEWDDLIFQNACEEASIIMSMHWVDKTSVTKEQAKQEILDLTAFEDRTYGQAYDRAAADAVKMFKDYYNYSNVRESEGISTKDIKAEILAGNLVIVPVNGQILKNPFYTPPGPEHHMLVVIGFDGKTNEFITNDVGTRHGQNYRYSEAKFQASLQDYPTGYELPSTPGKTAMIVVMPKN